MPCFAFRHLFVPPSLRQRACKRKSLQEFEHWLMSPAMLTGINIADDTAEYLLEPWTDTLIPSENENWSEGDPLLTLLQANL